MTKREFIIEVATKLQKQGSYCLSGDTCQYRENGKADDAKRCGIGHMIPDELYTEDLENSAAGQILCFIPIQEYFYKLLPEFDMEVLTLDYFLNQVQGLCHDDRARHKKPLLTPQEAMEICKHLL